MDILDWWLLAFLMGMVAMPVTGRLFAGFEDKGWMFSKVLAITVTGFLTWFLVTAKILPFTAATCIGVSVVCAVGCGVLYHFQGKNGIDCFPSGKVNLIYGEEILFFIFFLMWTYFAGFRPQAYGTEKFMDYGFMEAMMRSTTLPARDLWYSEGTINYYYGGQYFAVFLTKLTGSKVELTYNLMRTFVAAFAFVLPFSLVRQMSVDRLKGSLTGKKRCLPAVAGIIAGLLYQLREICIMWFTVRSFHGSRSCREKKRTATGSRMRPVILDTIRMCRTRRSMNFPVIPLCWEISMPMW